jgi:hypothetical protein
LVQRRLKTHFDLKEIHYKISHPKRYPTCKSASSLAAALCGSSIRKEGIVLEIAKLEIIAVQRRFADIPLSAAEWDMRRESLNEG